MLNRPGFNLVTPDADKQRRGWLLFWLTIAGMTVVVAMMALRLMPEEYQRLVAVTIVWSVVGFAPLFLSGADRLTTLASTLLLGAIGASMAARGGGPAIGWLIVGIMAPAGALALALSRSSERQD